MTEQEKLEPIEIDCNGSFLTPQIVELTLNKLKDLKIPKVLLVVAMTRPMWEKLKLDWTEVPGTIFDFYKMSIAEMPVKIDRGVPKGEIHLRSASSGEVVCKIKGVAD